MLLEEASRLEEGHSLADVTRLTEIEMRLEEIGSATAGERAKALLRNLGFTEALMVGGCKSFGWRGGVHLAGEAWGLR